MKISQVILLLTFLGRICCEKWILSNSSDFTELGKRLPPPKPVPEVISGIKRWIGWSKQIDFLGAVSGRGNILASWALADFALYTHRNNIIVRLDALTFHPRSEQCILQYGGDTFIDFTVNDRNRQQPIRNYFNKLRTHANTLEKGLKPRGGPDTRYVIGVAFATDMLPNLKRMRGSNAPRVFDVDEQNFVEKLREIFPDFQHELVLKPLGGESETDPWPQLPLLLSWQQTGNSGSEEGAWEDELDFNDD